MIVLGLFNLLGFLLRTKLPIFKIGKMDVCQKCVLFWMQQVLLRKPFKQEVWF